MLQAKKVIAALLLSSGGIGSVAAQSVSFAYPNDTIGVWTVPTGVTSVDVDVQGAMGAYYYNSFSNHIYGLGGSGGRVQATLAVTPGQILYCFVGGQGQESANNYAAGGWNGGGAGRRDVAGCAGGGGGASDIRLGDTQMVHRIIVAGGGGGSACGLGNVSADLSGGDGGGVIALPGHSWKPGEAGGGGSYNTGGSRGITPGLDTGTVGWFGHGGDGGFNPSLVDTVAGGGGGGGYYGGGGATGGGGGGGSSYADLSIASAVTHSQGYNAYQGNITLSYTLPAAVGTLVENVKKANIYPNPSVGNATLDISLTKGDVNVEVAVMDMMGRKVWEYSEVTKTKDARISIPGSALPAGVYSVHVITGGLEYSKALKLVKE